MSLENKKIFVTNALPYANGPIHIGHMVGYIQADIWSRFLRMQGHDVVFVCALFPMQFDGSPTITGHFLPHAPC